ncbi:MAG TPA: M56 family metallopeptidase [Vicinamibacterales bacterium]|nr:M56 family metallopeptidase [Vicinamibacterales bacterium]
MNAMAIADHPLAQALAWALLHFVWQGALLALGALVLFRLLARSASARYVVGVTALAAMLAAPIGTTAWLARATVTPAGAGPSGATMVAADEIAPVAVTSEPTTAGMSRSLTLTAAVLVIWLGGVAVLSIRLLGGWVTASRLARRALVPASPDVQATVRRLADRLLLRRVVHVAESSAVGVPIMIGWLKPVVILPAAVLSGFTPDQVEALLAHELAHVRRHDYLVNLLQAMVETALFYHPAVWWLSARVREEREHCCDDLAVEMCDRLVYVRALSDLAALTTPHLAMAASNGSLVARVRRILGRPPVEADAGSGWLPVIVLLALLAPVLPAAWTSGGPTAAAAAQTNAVAPQPAAAPAPVAQPEPAAGAERQGAASTTQAVPPRPATEPERTAPAETQAGEIGRVQEALRKWAEAQKELDAKRFDLEIAQADVRTKAQLDELAIKLEQLHKDLERAQRQVSAGLVSQDVLEDLRLKIVQTEKEMAGTKAQRDYDALRLRLDQTEVQQQRDYERLMREYQMLRGEAPPRDESAALRSALEAADDQTTPIREGDLLDIQVIGEPELAAVRVEPGGTIRLPFLPAITVGGLTLGQAGEAIVKQLAERHLASSPRVSVKRLRSPK